ncbi:type II toxin-antitoxin system Phd/YefM family antitoxin [Bacillus cereus]|uniref:type II toxin-antitoxin system Phd/YefM family antitoxin n=1 Tax=Bacillus cereus TaxID=1396 RepID=UPI0024060454|nr:type II toxin-antitoxin system Phd/YefM family antitoxin [Bacillus cereus]MDF9599117.1 type II toxin-antitoxin system Phd/YefM family antitoxin [Bacillus cereus]MDG1589450.1 type II toxin-antitoxin system Phd/YefM family antitoxin [Bacillus cereus]
MKIPNLHQLIISLTDFKKKITDIINKKETKVIMKNNEPIAVFMPYSEYHSMDNQIKSTGEDITLPNGVQIKVVVDTKGDDIFRDTIIIKTYIKMRTSGEYKLHFTQHLSAPDAESNLTSEEYIAYTDEKYNNKEN